MGIKFIILQNRQGKTRLTKWYTPDYKQKQKQRIIREIGHLVTSREKNKCNFLQWRECTLVYKRYASLYFIMCIGEEDNEILAMELIHQFVEVLDSYFGNVCELDLIFNFDKAHYILDELVLAGSVQETSKREITKAIKQQDDIETKIRDERKQSSSKKKQYLKEIFH
jgi:AP-1 complex subunit sigma 1/2